MTIHRIAALVAAATFAAPLAQAAEEYPARPVRMIIPFSAGGPTDVAGRILGAMLTELWGKPWVIDNRAGAGGVIAAEIAIKAAPDGYTLILGSNSTFAVNPALYTKLPYDPLRDLSLIGLAAFAPHVLTIRGNLPAKDVKELIALAKQQPSKLTFASSGLGTIIHMAGENFQFHAGINLTHVPFKGGGPAGVAMAAGEVDMMMNDLSPVIAHIRGGKLRPIGVANTRRAPLVPEVPTFPEIGMPGVVSASWFGLAAPIKTPAGVIQRISEGVNKVVNSPEYKDRLAALGLEPLVKTPKETTAQIASEIAQWRKLAKANNIKLD